VKPADPNNVAATCCGCLLYAFIALVIFVALSNSR
jgi:hypothetical protein